MTPDDLTDGRLVADWRNCSLSKTNSSAMVVATMTSAVKDNLPQVDRM
jgi:hypothetical protein